MTRPARRGLVALIAAVLALATLAAPAQADHGGSHGSVGGHNDGDTATGDAGYSDEPTGTGSGGGGSSEGPSCRYDGLYHTTQEEQRNEIRPEETRPGVWGWWVCDDGTRSFRFFPDSDPVDPTHLAESVSITPPPLELRTNPAESARSLVNLETWFWATEPAAMSETATAGPVQVTVSAVPGALVVDPGDGSGPFTCEDMGVAYDTSRPAAAQSTTCGHTYDRPGTYTATATVSYDVEFSSNVGAGGDLGTIDRARTVELTVVESQAIVTR